MPKTVKVLTISISPEKLNKLRTLCTNLRAFNDKQLLAYLNADCKEGKAYYNSSLRYFRVYLLPLGLWLYLGSGVPVRLNGKIRKGVEDVEKGSELHHLPDISLEFELQRQAQEGIGDNTDAPLKKAQATAGKEGDGTGVVVRFTKKMVDKLREETKEGNPALTKMDDGEVISYLNKNNTNVSYRRTFGSKLIFLESLKIALKISGHRQVVVKDIKRDPNSRGNEQTEVRYELGP